VNGSLLVVCRGNIHRSPVVAHALAERLPGVSVSSAGLVALCGQPSPPEVVAEAADFGIDLHSHRAERLAAPSVAAADLILTMSRSQARSAVVDHGALPAQLVVFSEFAELLAAHPSDSPIDVISCLRARGRVSLNGLGRPFDAPTEISRKTARTMIQQAMSICDGIGAVWPTPANPC
jgi:protein-tyrosine-phosphatase